MTLPFLKRPALNAVTDQHFIPVQETGGPASRVNATVFTAGVVAQATTAATNAAVAAAQQAGAVAGAAAGSSAGSAAANAALGAINLDQKILDAVIARLTQLGYTGNTGGNTGGGTVTPVTLPTMTISTSARTLTEGSFSAGDELAVVTLSGPLPSSVAPTVSPNDGRIALSGVGSDNRFGVRVGLTASSVGSTTYTISVAQPDATNTPQQVTFALTVQAAEVVPPDGTARTATKLADYPVVGYAAPVGSVSAMGHPFVYGDLRNSETLELRRAGAAIPSQWDVVDNPADDGSRRYAVAHVPSPAVIANGSSETWELWRKPKASSPTALDFLAKIAAHSCSVKFTNGSNSATINVLDPALFNGATPWFSGPFAVQIRARVAIPTAAVGGNADPELWVDVTAFSDNTLHVDLSVHNDFCYMPRSQGSIAYRMEMTANGQKILDENVTLHEHKKRFARERRFTTSGTLVDRPLTLKPDLDYWSKTGFVANYDRALGVTSQVLSNQLTSMANPYWSQPFTNRDLKLEMTGPGGDAGIGEAPASGVIALMYGTRDTLNYAMGQSEAYDGLNMHFWDAEKNQHVNVVTRPFARTNTGILQPAEKLYYSGDATGWDIDEAHWADTGIVPYLLTGRRSRLDQINTMAVWFATKSGPADFERGNPFGRVNTDETPEGEATRINYYRNTGYAGMDLQQGNQVRGYAWGKRQVREAWCLVPPAEQPAPQGPLYNLLMIADARAQRGRYEYVKDAQGSVTYGWFTYATYGNNVHQAPWQHMFALSDKIRTCYLNGPDAKYQLDKLFNFLLSMGMDSLGPNGEFFSGLNVGAYNLRTTKVQENTQDYGKASDISRTPMDFINTQAGQHFYTATGSGDYPFTGPDGKVLYNSGNDYHGRWISILSQAYDLFTFKGWDTTRIKQAQASAARWVQNELFLTNPNFQSGPTGPQISIVMRGTTRLNGGTQGQVAPGATLPSVYPLPYQQPLPAA